MQRNVPGRPLTQSVGRTVTESQWLGGARQTLDHHDHQLTLGAARASLQGLILSSKNSNKKQE